MIKIFKIIYKNSMINKLINRNSRKNTKWMTINSNNNLKIKKMNRKKNLKNT